MKNNFFLFVILCSLFSCGRQKTTSDPAQENAKYSHNFTKLFAMKIKDKYNLTMDASGGSYYILMASFEAPFSCQKNQTRKLLFQCADECLKMMNADPKMKTIKRKKSAVSATKSEWTKEVDFDYSNLKFIIGFKDDKKEHDPPNINFASFAEDGISYFIYDVKKQDEVFFFHESLDEALEKIKSE